MPHGFALPHNISVAPRVWVLTGEKAGENTQVLALAETLGWPFEIKQFVYNAAVPDLPVEGTLADVDKKRSSPIEAPWPDLVICASRRNEPIARWIKEQSPDTTRLIHLGRPRGSVDDFDLVVTTPQYRSPTTPEVVDHQTPLSSVAKDCRARAAAH